jgi:hypothetical protein
LLARVVQQLQFGYKGVEERERVGGNENGNGVPLYDHHHQTELQLLGDIHNPDESPKKTKQLQKNHLKNT